MLLELAIGDAYGAGFEFAPEEKVKTYNNLTSYQQHEVGILPGHYTDDTQMSIAIAELIIEGQELTRENFANRFVVCFKRDPRLGYAKGLYEFYQSISSGNEMLEKIKPTSIRNGAAMRAAPLGVINDLELLLTASKEQASVTHNTDIGIISAQAVSLCSHFFIYNKGKPAELLDFISDYTNYKWNGNWCNRVACHGIETVEAVITVLLKSQTLSEILIQSVAFTGDVDTVASLALGIASQSDSYENDLPKFLYNDLENGAYGKDFLVSVGHKLMSCVQK